MPKKSGYREVAAVQRMGFARAQMRYAEATKKAKPELFKDIGSALHGLSQAEAAEIYWFSIMYAEGPGDAAKEFAKFVPKEMLIEAPDPDEKGVFLAAALTEAEWNEQYGNDTTH